MLAVSQLDTLEKNTKRVSTKLGAMSRMQFGDRWNTVNQAPQKNTAWSSVTRTLWYRNESANMSAADFSSTLKEAFTLIYDCIDKYDGYDQDGKNTIVRLIILLVDGTNDVKLAIVRQQGAYINDSSKADAIAQMDNIVAYVDDQTHLIEAAIREANITQSINKKCRTRRKHAAVIPVDTSYDADDDNDNAKAYMSHQHYGGNGGNGGNDNAHDNMADMF